MMTIVQTGIAIMEKKVYDLVNDSIMNDEFSTDDELVELLKSNGVPYEIALNAPSLRDAARIDPFSTLIVKDGVLSVTNGRS